MLAISVYQPWASLMAIEEKRCETRSWAIYHRGPLAIHATAGKPDPIAAQHPFSTALARHGYSMTSLPRGAIVTVVLLVSCIPLVMGYDSLSHNRFGFPEFEESFGDFSRGRFAWITTSVYRLATPIPARGHQGLWQWTPPDDLALPAWARQMDQHRERP